MPVKTILIVSPATAKENNGNWQTATRWARFLQGHYSVSIAGEWDATQNAPDLLIALHARRSATALANFAAAHPGRPRILVLTGTDLYRDIHSDAQAKASLQLASALVVLQDAGAMALPAGLRGKTNVIYQSAPPLRPYTRKAAPRYRDICMVGHLRDEKDPLTFMRAAGLARVPSLRFVHIGGALDPALGEAARHQAAANPRYRWLGALPHAATRQRLKRCHAMAIASRMEGGANVIIEAVSCDVPVLASDISGNRGMLGNDYLGYFPPGDAAALARLAERTAIDPAFHAALLGQCRTRAPLFKPQAEQASLLELVDNLDQNRSA